MPSDKNNFYHELYIKHVPRLVEHAERKLGDHSLAQDMVEETMLIAWAKIEELMVHKAPLAWLYKTLNHLIVREKQKKYYQAEVALDDSILKSYDLGVEGQLLESIPKTLPKEEAELLVMRFKEQLSFLEIGERLGIAEAAAKKRCFRAMQHLRRLLL